MKGVRTFFTAAFPADGDSDLRGRLFLVNRGPHGGGYLRCPRCEHAEPAPAGSRHGKPVKSKHNNPRTGSLCPVSDLRFPIDLGHIFETDVRGFSFAKRFPRFAEGAQDEAREGFLRTLAEALRLASSRMLRTDSRDLAATSQTDRGQPVVILYDSVPGGAGYVRRIGSGGAFATAALLAKAIRVLECPIGCASSCSKCLNDYGNQAHWDLFNRHSVLRWLKELRKSTLELGDIAPAGAVRWESPSLEGLRKAMLGVRRIELFVNQLHGCTDASTATRTAQFLRTLLEAGRDRQVRVYSQRSPRLSPLELHGSDLQPLSILAEQERLGRIRFHSLRPIDDRIVFPRLVADSAGLGKCFYVDARERPLLDGLLPGDFVFKEGRISGQTKGVIDSIKQHAQVESGALASLVQDTKRFDYHPGDQRDPREPFAPLVDADDARILVRDPYLLTRASNRESAALLLRLFCGLGVGLKNVTLVWRPRTRSFDRHGQLERRLFQDEMKRQGLALQCVGYAPRRKGEGGHFHDRWIQAKFKRNGSEQIYRWDLTSGVDNLMDLRKEATVFVTRIH